MGSLGWVMQDLYGNFSFEIDKGILVSSIHLHRLYWLLVMLRFEGMVLLHTGVHYLPHEYVVGIVILWYDFAINIAFLLVIVIFMVLKNVVYKLSASLRLPFVLLS